MRRDKESVGWAGLFVIAGWLIQVWLAGDFGPYAIALMIAGVVGTAGSGSILVAPLGLLVGELAAILVRGPQYNALEIGVTVTALSMTVLAGLITRSLLGGGGKSRSKRE